MWAKYIAFRHYLAVNTNDYKRLSWEKVLWELESELKIDPRREDKKKFFSNLGKIIDFSREDLGGDFMNNEIKVGNWLLRIFGEAERRKKVKDIFEIIEGE